MDLPLSVGLSARIESNCASGMGFDQTLSHMIDHVFLL